MAKFNTKTRSLADRIKGKVIDKTSDVLSFPKRFKEDRRVKRFNKTADILKQTRKYKGMPDFDAKGRATDALKMRTIADTLKARLNKK